MIRLLHIVTDFSFVGGDHVYVLRMLRHLAEHHATDFELHVAEIMGHATGQDLSVYTELDQLGVHLHSIPDFSPGYLQFVVPTFLSSVITGYRIDIVHSHIFVADLAVTVARRGSREYLRDIAGENGFRHGPVIDDIIRSGITDISQIYLDMLPVGGEPPDVDLAPATFGWISTKHLGALKSICQERDLEKLYPDDRAARQRGLEANQFLQVFVSQAADEIIVISTHARRLWEPHCRVRHIPVAVIGPSDWSGLESLRGKVGRAYESESRTFVFVGRLARKKNPVLLISAFREHSRKRPGDRLIMVGDGRQMPQCLVAAEGMANVEFLGHVTPERVLEILAAADALCLFSDEEGLPLVVQEAMAAGTAVLSTRAGGVPDVVEDGLSGFLIDCPQRENIENLLMRYATLDADQRRRMSICAEERMRNWVLDVDCFEEYVGLYLRLVPQA